MIEIHGEHVANVRLKGKATGGVVLEGDAPDGVAGRWFFPATAEQTGLAFEQARQMIKNRSLGPFDWHIVID